jgi:DNA polymerase
MTKPVIDWGYIGSTIEQWREEMLDETNHICVDYESYYDSDYSLRKKDMTYIKYANDERFKFQSVAFAYGREGEIEYVEDVHVIEAIKDIFVPGNKLVLLGQNLMFDGMMQALKIEGAVPHMYLDLLGMSRATFPHAMRHDLDSILHRLYPNDRTMRKGLDLAFVKGKVNLTAQDHKVLRPYNIQDIRITRAPIYKYLDAGFPVDELLTQDILLKMACDPPFKADKRLLQSTYTDAKIRQDDAVDGALEFMLGNTKIDQAFFTPTDDRDTNKWRTQKAYVEWYRTQFGGLPPIKKEEEQRKFLSGNDKFAYYLRAGHGVAVGLKDSPTPLDPDNETWALSKDDVQFQVMMAQNRDLQPIWEGRILVKSNMDKTRAETLLYNANACGGWLAIVIKYGAAHTHRFGGGQKINPQNFGRGSNHRLSLLAPEGFRIGVSDSSNIEARLSAWFCEFEEKLQLFRDGGDPYNEMGTQIFGYQVQRKSKTLNHKLEGMVGKATELGCGYQMGAVRFRNYLNAGPLGDDPIFLEDVKALEDQEDPYKYVVNKYRKANYPIRNMWKRLESVIQDMTFKDTNYTMMGVRILHKKIQLPSGLCLHYPQLGRRRDKDGGMQWTYKSSKGFTNLFGGKLLENIIQALARQVVVEQMLWIAAYLTKFDGCRVSMQVHDEVIANILEDKADEIQAMCEELMRQAPDWCSELPLDSEGGHAHNYSK